jgi:hypothetical protein
MRAAQEFRKVLKGTMALLGPTGVKFCAALDRLENTWGVISYDDEKKRWQWWSRHVTEEDARVMYDRRTKDSSRALLVLMNPPVVVHQCDATCACIKEIDSEWTTPV